MCHRGRQIFPRGKISLLFRGDFFSFYTLETRNCFKRALCLISCQITRGTIEGTLFSKRNFGGVKKFPFPNLIQKLLTGSIETHFSGFCVSFQKKKSFPYSPSQMNIEASLIDTRKSSNMVQIYKSYEVCR